MHLLKTTISDFEIDFKRIISEVMALTAVISCTFVQRIRHFFSRFGRGHSSKDFSPDFNAYFCSKSLRKSAKFILEKSEIIWLAADKSWLG